MLSHATRRLCVLVFVLVALDLKAQPPNFLFLLVDDLGWADLGYSGSAFHKTPNIDALASSGMHFTQAYTAGSVCSPTRASILTGRHPVRVGITDWIPGQRRSAENGAMLEHVEDRDALALEEVTIAEILKDADYQTFFAGKWHLGSEGALPTDQGFDINIGGHHKGSPPGGYYAPWTNPYLEAREEGEYLTERLTEESVRFMENADRAKPFLLYLSYYNVHTPIQAYQKRVGAYRDAMDNFEGPTPTRGEEDGTTRLRQDNPEYASMVAAVDDSVGLLMAHLDRLGLAEDTVVIFYSDNGGLSTLARGRPGPTSNQPLRAGKGWLFEGGIRSPAIIRAPGITRAGSRSDAPILSTDLFPTMVALAGLAPRLDLAIDGRSLMGLLREASWGEPRALHWHYPHYHGSGWRPGGAIRYGDWKLIEFFESGRTVLFDLAADPEEQRDLSASHPEVSRELSGRLAGWRERMGAVVPKPLSVSAASTGGQR